MASCSPDLFFHSCLVNPCRWTVLPTQGLYFLCSWQQGLNRWLISSHWKVSRGLYPTEPYCVEPQVCLPHSLPPTSSRKQVTVMRTQLKAATQQKEPSPDSPHTGDTCDHLEVTEGASAHSSWAIIHCASFLSPHFSLLTLNNPTFNMLTFIRFPNISGRTLNFPLISLGLWCACLFFFLTEGQFLNAYKYFLNLKAEVHVREKEKQLL